MLGLLTALTVLAVWVGFILNDQPETRGCGGDFRPFYIAGKMVSHGDAKRLYDQPYYRHFEMSIRNDPLGLLLYPPTVGLLVAPWRGFPTTTPWPPGGAIQAVCILATGVIFYRSSSLPRPWRINLLVALTALAAAVDRRNIGHLTPMLLLVLAGGLTLHKQGKRGWAGLALSLLALKPQLAVGLVLWMLLPRDLRTLAGPGRRFRPPGPGGGRCPWPGLWLDYLHALPTIVGNYPQVSLLAGVRAIVCRHGAQSALGGRAATWRMPAMKIAHIVTASAAAVLLCRVAWAQRPSGPLARWERGRG